MGTIKTIFKSVLFPVLGTIILVLVFLVLGSLILILSIPTVLFMGIASVFKASRDVLALLLKGLLDGVAQAIAHGGAKNKEKQ